MPLKITNNYSPNFSINKRLKQNIKFIILHYTGMKNESSAIDRLCNSNSNVSSHYFIKKNGNILRLVPDLYQAWHAGKSRWKKFKSLNKYSIGIEIQNSGHNNLYENFTNKQRFSLKKLLRFLLKTYKINYKNVLGHSDISPNRKKDPGEKFPWEFFYKNKLAHWHSLNKNKLTKSRHGILTINEKKEFLINLYKIGYNKIENMKVNQNNKLLIKSFQRRFRQDLVNGVIDKECLLINRDLTTKS